MAVAAHRRGALAVALVALMAAVGPAGADYAADSKLCADKLAVLATCLPFVVAPAPARAPTPDCCVGPGRSWAAARRLCVLIKDRDDPALGIKANVTRAMDLPSACSVPAVLSDCPKLLHISPDSKEADIFKQYALHKGKNATAVAGTAGGRAPTRCMVKGGTRRSSLPSSCRRCLPPSLFSHDNMLDAMHPEGTSYASEGHKFAETEGLLVDCCHALCSEWILKGKIMICGE
ncbi:hypothetical protein ZWY2020_046763 [Hordeum vulgare]|nr:hypothetical protein ZWY2020_046763 [Hordeum vulgare]